MSDRHPTDSATLLMPPARLMKKKQQRGQFYRLLLKQVKPQHIAAIIDTFQKLQLESQIASGPASAPWWMPLPHDCPEPGNGPWWIPLPHGYRLLVQGSSITAIEPPSQPLLPGDLSPTAQDTQHVTKDTQTIRRLSKQLRSARKSKRDSILQQLYSLDWNDCSREALQAIELATYDLIAQRGK